MSSGDSRSRIESIVREYLSDCESGDDPSREQLLQDHPDISAELKEFFDEQDKRAIDLEGKETHAKFDPLVSTHMGNTAEAPAGLPLISEASSNETPDGSTTAHFDSQADTMLPSVSPFDSQADTVLPSHSTVTSSDQIPSPKKFVGDYELLTQIGRGGMGVVYKARQQSLDRIVALKMIRSGELASKREIDRFRLEAEAAAELDHPAIVPVFEVGESSGTHFFSMGFVEGQSLGSRLKDGPMEPPIVGALVAKLAHAVAYAHERGVIHRDLKPDNVLLDEKEQPRITDFGLAKRMDADSEFTRTGEVLGTPAYMPPEQAKGGAVGPPADVYGLGAILYAMLAARPPFQAASQMDTLRQVLDKEPVAPRQLDSTIPRDLETICLNCLQKNPHKRYANATDLADDLQRYVDGKPIQARPVGITEKGWMWCKRNPGIAVASAVAGLLALVLMVGGPILAANFYEQKEVAESNAKKAIDSAGMAADNSRLVLDRIHKGWRQTPIKDREMMTDLLELALNGMVDISKNHQDFARADIGIASAHKKIGEVFLELGQTEKALEHLGLSLKIAIRLEAEGTLDDPNGNLALIHELLGSASKAAGKYDQARQHFIAVADHWTKRIQEKPSQREGFLNAIAKAHGNLGALATKQGKVGEAREYGEKVLEHRRKWLEKNSSSLSAHLNLVGALGTMADVEFAAGNYTSLRAHQQERIDKMLDLFGRAPTNKKVYGNLGLVYLASAGHALMEGKHTEAQEQYERALPHLRNLAESDVENASYQRRLGDALQQLGTTMKILENADDATKHLNESLEIRTALQKIDPNNDRRKVDLMIVLAWLGKHAQAADITRELQDGSPDERLLKDIASGFALCHAATENGEEKQVYLKSSLAALRESVNKGYGDLQMLQRDPDLAAIRDTPEFQEILGQMKKTPQAKTN